MFNTSTQSTSVILVGAARCPMIQLATTVASRLLISARLSGRSLRLLHPSLNAALGLMYCSRRLQLPSAGPIELPFQMSYQVAKITVVL
ncbi:putative 2,5 RNA ligase [Trichinella spiralis]|uniref:putative 2,5 RNA ligase n=1 Tax=Trichinella spiralis TaxID=6334 RepID=UPI0001EFBB64|nr:putative 2,5 RNA ligase [Trichinella spiralis]